MERFNVKIVPGVAILEGLQTDALPDCLFFDYDYPDRQRLSVFSATKERFPSIPMVLVTMQHSVSLAVWCFRHGALDFLIKPLKRDEIMRCAEHVQEICSAKNNRDRKGCKVRKPAVPFNIPGAARSARDRLSPAIFYIQQHYSDRIYSDAMARICGMSASQFSRAFRQQYNLTFQEFLLRYRVHKACGMLQRQGSNIADIAYNVGFSDPSYFSRIFKRYAGVAPSDFVAANDETGQVGLEEDLSSGSQVVRALSLNFRNG